MEQITADWPDDDDGDVFRSLAAQNFNFSLSWCVDYNVDFKRWPPDPSALDLLRKLYGEISVYPPDKMHAGYVQIQIVGPVSYEAVTSTQRRMSVAMAPFGGICESWGVLH